MTKQAQLAMAIALFAAVACGEPIEQLLTNQPAMLDLLKKELIHAAVQGRIPSPFGDVARSFEGTNLLAEVDAAYGRLLQPGEKPAFELHTGTSNVYHYLSREGKTSDVTEVCRSRTATNELSAVYYVTGRRFFGSFRSLIHITVSNAPPEGVAYAVDVYGYPETAVTRFLIHRLHLVEHYFRNHTVIITRLIENIGKELCRPREHDGTARVASL